ncbi:CbiQ family ECF transporter T component [Clostridium oceanicum]|uniref:Cobalt ECF transporter T component CbiQ n=1 Tax=Clostridium oceanicum TaxID=1543 RepID=A0ABP3URC0_9CLOT
MLKLISLLAKQSKLASIHPLEKMILSISPIIIIGFTQNYNIIILNILVFIILHLLASNNKKIFTKITLEVTGFALISSITFVFDYGFYYVSIILLKSVSAGLCLSYFSLTTPIDDVLYFFSKIDFLKDMCDISKSMERFLVLINDEYIILYNSIKSRGGFESFSLKVKNTGKMAGLIFVNTMNRWKVIREALHSRGYRGYTPYLDKNFDFSLKRAILVIIYIVMLVLLVYLNIFFF